jgi:hypothetical protein
MADVSLTVYCDNSAACYATVSVGAGWARVTVHAPPAIAGERLVAELPRAAAMLAAAGGPGDAVLATFEARALVSSAPQMQHLPRRPNSAPAVCISGPDAPPDPDPLRLEALRVWGIATLAPSGAPGPNGAALAPSGAPLGPAEVRLEDTIRQWGDEARLKELARRWSHEALVTQMVGTVAAHVSQYGSAPDFASARPSDREKAYNYIRSTTAKPQASGEVVEEVRRHLAGQ